jgi:acetylornithine deacetylase/succinyl-diaminopimelate desuccinylase-like protein
MQLTGYDASTARLIEQAVAAIDEQALVDLLVHLINIPSRTGDEEPIARAYRHALAELGLNAALQMIEHNRANTVGVLRGTGGGAALMFNGHFDTSATGVPEEDFPLVGPAHPDILAVARIDGDVIHGLGAQNMKGALAAMAMAAGAINRAGLRLPGSLLVTGVAGEIEKSPVDGAFQRYHGRHFRGGGIGAECMLSHGVTADAGICGEPTGGYVSWSNPGYCWFKISTRGRVAYQAVKSSGRSAILDMLAVIQAFERWGPEYSRRHRGDLFEPQATIGAIESGWPYKPSYLPAICNMYVDVRMVPEQVPQDVQVELEQLLDDVRRHNRGLEVTCEMYMSNRSAATSADAWIITACKRAFEAIRQQPHPERCPPAATNFWGDASVMRKHGIPTAMMGPGGYDTSAAPTDAPFPEYVSRAELLESTRMYIAAAIDTCTRAPQVVQADSSSTPG